MTWLERGHLDQVGEGFVQSSFKNPRTPLSSGKLDPALWSEKSFLFL